MANANRAGRMTLSMTVKPAYIVRKAGLFARGERPVCRCCLFVCCCVVVVCLCDFLKLLLLCEFF